MNNKVNKRRRFKSVDAMVKALSTKKFYKEWVRQKVEKRKHRSWKAWAIIDGNTFDIRRKKEHFGPMVHIRATCPDNLIRVTITEVRPLNNKVEGR